MVPRWVLHRDGGPARIEEKPDGSMTERYFLNGKLHRDNGPARSDRDPQGQISEYWYREGKLHREDGPAVVQRGAYEASSYWRDGVELEHPSEREPNANEQTKETRPATAQQRYVVLIQKQNYPDRAKDQPIPDRPKDPDRDR
jgi:hypothetical protein